MNIRSSLFKLYKINQETVFFRHCVYSESGTAKDGHMHIKNMILNKTSQKWNILHRRSNFDAVCRSGRLPDMISDRKAYLRLHELQQMQWRQCTV